MKSPWNFLTRLTSRRKQDDAQQTSVEQDRDHKAIEAEAEKKPALRLASPELTPVADGDSSTASDLEKITNSVEADDVRAIPAADIQEVPTSTPDAIDESGADLHTPVSEEATTAKSSKAVRTKRLRRVKTDHDQPVETKALSRNEDQVAQPVPPVNPFLNEVSKLDEDIKVLRSELTRKLILQNDHLKKMLERFDRH